MEITFLHIIIFSIITTSAYLLKGLTGFGPAIVIISTAVFIWPTRDVIIVAVILDIIAGVVLFVSDRSPRAASFWIPMAVAVSAGSIVGAFGFRVAPSAFYDYMLGTAIACLGVWFLVGSPGRVKANPGTPSFSKGSALAASLGGLSGGLFGISGPPIIYYLGKTVNKSMFRSILIPVFLMEALTRISVYTVSGILGIEHLYLALIGIPGMLLGLFVGSRLHLKINESLFQRIIGSVLFLSALRLIFF